jgi:phosphatidylserine/phosphatidylglycerophosphate/cardiolipin synthase-like enzyme
MKKIIVTLLAAAILSSALAKKSHAPAVDRADSVTMASAGQVEVAFSPDEGSERLVIKVIDSAHTELRVLAYSFTSVPVVEALLRAKHRGVDIRLVADEKDSHHDKARAALGALATAGVDVRTISVYAIHHDKVVVADRQTVELGSFNFSDAAAHKNSENVLVHWNNPQLAAAYLAHFERNYRQARAYEPGF